MNTQVTLPLTVRALVDGDLASCGWSGGPVHLEHVARALERSRGGEVDYLAVCPPSDVPVGIGGVDYAVSPGAGTLWQLAVHPALRSCGIGTVLVRAAEARIAARGLRRAELSVEEPNVRARALYERLGYIAAGTRAESCDVAGRDGSLRRHHAVCLVMHRELTPPGLPLAEP